MLLNKIPCLDKGYVAYLDSSCDSPLLKEVAIEFFKRTDGKFLTDIATLTLIIKCPLFVQLNLSTHDLRILPTPTTPPLEAYYPNVGDIGAPEHDVNVTISENMRATTEALLINPAAYQYDGCNKFVSQVLTPINTYTTLIVHGSYNDWRKFCYQQGVPPVMKSYVDAVQQIMSNEWR